MTRESIFASVKVTSQDESGSLEFGKIVTCVSQLLLDVFDMTNRMWALPTQAQESSEEPRDAKEKQESSRQDLGPKERVRD